MKNHPQWQRRPVRAGRPGPGARCAQCSPTRWLAPVIRIGAGVTAMGNSRIGVNRRPAVINSQRCAHCICFSVAQRVDADLATVCDDLGAACNQGASMRVDNGINQNTITGVSTNVLIRTRGNNCRWPNSGPSTKLNNSETGKNASHTAIACFQRGGGDPLLPNQASIPRARCSEGWANRPLPRTNQEPLEAECSQACMVASSAKRKII